MTLCSGIASLQIVRHLVSPFKLLITHLGGREVKMARVKQYVACTIRSESITLSRFEENAMYVYAMGALKRGTTGLCVLEAVSHFGF